MRAVLRQPRWSVALALLLAAASLPLGHALAFDASAWVVWGREVWSLDLRTGAGPSWKPFPILVTGPAAILGDGAAGAWLVVARAGAVLAVVGAARLAGRASGPWGALVAVAAIVLSPWWLLNGALGNADPLLGALAVWAILLTVDGRPRAALVLVVLGALIRPEAWPFALLFALRQIRRRELTWAGGLSAGALVLALWIVPDLLSSGLRSTTGATGTASAGSASNTAFPFGAVLSDLGEQARWVVLAAAVAGVAALARRARRRGAGSAAGPPPAEGTQGPPASPSAPTPPATSPSPAAARPAVWLGVVLAYALLVAVMAQVGFAGNPRYLVPGLVLLGAVAGTVVGVVPDGAPAGARGAFAILLVALLAVTGAGDLRDQGRDLRRRAEVRRALFRAVDVADPPRGRVRSAAPDLRSVVAEAAGESVPAANARARPGDVEATQGPGERWTLRTVVP